MRNIIYFSSILVFFSCSESIEPTNEIEQNPPTEIGELINFADAPELDTLWPMFESYSGQIMNLEAYQGNYNIDTLQDNLHSHSEFKFELITTDESCVLYFISCSDYGYASSWEKGQVFGIIDSLIDSLIDSESNRFAARINEHRGSDEFELTTKEVVFTQNEIIIYSGLYKDHYKRISD